jgi:CheY-like chemotaxis protein
MIRADPTNIHRIIVNLCTNALHAMKDEKGMLTIKLSRRKVIDEEIGLNPDVSAGTFVVLSVSDTGCGMDEEQKERIFEPYFTTKETGEGTGLGLSVIHGIVNDYRGFIRVDSTPGKGSTFSVYLPASQEEESRIDEPAEKELENQDILFTGKPHILVVDDEPILVIIHKLRLENCGFRVTGTSESREALEKIRAQPDRFDLLITDQTMPGMSGVDLVKAVHEIKPGFPVILCTGHSKLISKDDIPALGIKRYLSKPTFGNELTEAVKQVLMESNR